MLLLNYHQICAQTSTSEKPNVILIMADDMGAECLGSYGSLDYKTPVLDQLASQGIRFTNCISQPLCTPSRVKMMTGLYNYRNYEYFGYLGKEQKTFGHIMQEAGYTSCIAGKWQLNGLAYKNQLKDWKDKRKPNQLGFDYYSLWQLTKSRSDGERYANPLIEQDGKVLNLSENDYGPDIFSEYVLDFIENNHQNPFFIYYPMVLVHDPFVPTPDSDQWSDQSIRYKNDTAYFKDMVSYTDKIVGKIVGKLKEHNQLDNTLIIFTGDNGTHTSIVSRTNNGEIRGGKGNTIDAGTKVPLIVHWPDQIEGGSISEELISFSDFFATFADLAGIDAESDGHSFLPLLKGESFTARQSVLVHYDPKWGANVNRYRNRFSRTRGYKLYIDGKFYNLDKDPMELEPIAAETMSTTEMKIHQKLQKELDQAPLWQNSK
ncbi:sulfatase-like hydrolase/transferase [Porifericola rhodea]|uniref:sulfatase-like hydrolase/transferase n=1 Tax=Porifericola rhodea TaxID=930972 RepID=UPI002665A6E1|nr:sulfatase-like hydrolase/transferase [Porifericola rhodea]WKN30833.1 sulfatase-like hydrolase/transferase [Porifericola rhodea]